MRKVVAVGVLLATLASCSGARDSGKIKVVASFYPLAWAARAVGGDAVEVVDLTPAGVEAHDLQLSANQRASIADADVIVVLGRGFQPEVEEAATDSRGLVLDVIRALEGSDPAVSTSLRRVGSEVDPHVWLSPRLMRAITATIGDRLKRKLPGSLDRVVDSRTDRLWSDLAELQAQFMAVLSACRLRTLATTHEAFSYWYTFSLKEFGLTGVTPESEPRASRIQTLRSLVAQQQVAAVFYEETDEGRRIGESVARDLGIDALPLNTLEHDPKPNDYISQMRANLESLKKGLQCN